MYLYSLVRDGKIVDTKQIILTKKNNMKQKIIKFMLIIIAVFYMCINLAYPQLNPTYSRSNWCGTKASKEDIEFVKELLKNSLKSTQIEGGITYFRVQHHIVRDGNGNNGLSPSVIPGIMSYMNNAFYDAAIQFYSCNPTEIIDSDDYYQIDNYSEEQSLRNTYNDPDAINIYYFYPLINGYWAYTYQNGTINFIGVRNELAPNGSTVTHEMGHFFGLLHTFQGYSTPVTSSMEFVTRGTGKNCDTAGDLLCDTPADPYIGKDEVNTSCSYIGTATDFNNVAYTPDVSNFMAYSRHECRNQFSSGQLSIISNMASSSGKQVFNHTTEISNNSNLNGNTTDDFIIVTNSTVNSGSNVVLDACNETEIKNNFEVKVGATFEAK